MENGSAETSRVEFHFEHDFRVASRRVLFLETCWFQALETDGSCSRCCSTSRNQSSLSELDAAKSLLINLKAYKKVDDLGEVLMIPVLQHLLPAACAGRLSVECYSIKS